MSPLALQGFADRAPFWWEHGGGLRPVSQRQRERISKTKVVELNCRFAAARPERSGIGTTTGRGDDVG